MAPSWAAMCSTFKRPLYPTHMSHTRVLSASIALFALFAGACSGKDTASSDSALERDLTLAAATAAPLEIADTALASAAAAPARRNPKPAPVKPKVTPARVTPAPQPTFTPAPAPAPAPSTGLIAAGTALLLSTSARVCTNTNRPGDKQMAAIENAAMGTNGVMIPAGSRALVEVATVTPGEGSKPPTITFRVRSIVTDAGTFAATGDAEPTGELERSRAEGSKSSDMKKVIGGAILGAVLGQAMGKDTKGTVIGAAAGAAAGTAAAKATAKSDSCLPAGAPLRLVLEEAVVIAVN